MCDAMTNPYRTRPKPKCSKPDFDDNKSSKEIDLQPGPMLRQLAPCMTVMQKHLGCSMENAFFQVDFKYFLLFQSIIQPCFKQLVIKLSEVVIEIGFEELPHFLRQRSDSNIIVLIIIIIIYFYYSFTIQAPVEQKPSAYLLGIDLLQPTPLSCLVPGPLHAVIAQSSWPRSFSLFFVSFTLLCYQLKSGPCCRNCLTLQITGSHMTKHEPY